jgi:hypothetical protein
MDFSGYFHTVLLNFRNELLVLVEVGTNNYESATICEVKNTVFVITLQMKLFKYHII